MGAVLASHDDTTVADVAESRDVKCVLAEFPTTMEAAAQCNDAGMAVMMGAPNLMRGKSHSGNISADELVAPGYLQILSSDYVPSTLLRAAVKLAQRIDDMAAAMATVTSEPARVTGLVDRGVWRQDCARISCALVSRTRTHHPWRVVRRPAGGLISHGNAPAGDPIPRSACCGHAPRICLFLRLSDQ